MSFPSPADDHVEQQLDLNELLVQHPSATFFMRVEGDTMISAGIRSGDLLVVDRSRTPGADSIVVAAIDGQLTVRSFDALGGAEESEVWGVVTAVIHQM